jgi:hypothetical protein
MTKKKGGLDKGGAFGVKQAHAPSSSPFGGKKKAKKKGKK